MKRGVYLRKIENKKANARSGLDKFGGIFITRPKRAQQTMGIPFNFIFAMFLIVIFISIAFIAIKSFLEWGRTSEVGLFYDGLQKEIDSALASDEYDKGFEVELPSGIIKVCFANLSAQISDTNSSDYLAIRDYEVYEDANIFLVPPEKAEGMPYKSIDKINITKITENKNPYCVDITKRNELRIKKGIYSKFVWIE